MSKGIAACAGGILLSYAITYLITTVPNQWWVVPTFAWLLFTSVWLGVYGVGKITKVF